MAELTALIELRGIDKLSQITQKAQKNYQKFAKGIEKHNKKLGGVFGKLKGTTTKLAGAFSRLALPITALTGAAGLGSLINFGGDFQESLADLSAITGAAGQDLDFLKNKALEFSRTSVKPAAQVAEAFKLVASANSELLSDLGGLSKVTQSVLLLSNASKLDLATSAKVATQAMNQFKLGAEDAGRAVNVLAAGSKVGASEVPETGQALIKAGVAARGAKLSFEETNSAIQILAKGGIKGSEAGTALRNIFNRLEKQTNKKLRPSIVGINQALENLSKTNLDTAESTKLFGEEAHAAATILVENRRLFSQWTREITNTSIAEEQAAKNLDTFNVKAKKLGISIQNILIKSFLRLEPALSSAVSRVEGFFASISDKQIKDFTNLVYGLGRAFGALVNFATQAASKIISIASNLAKFGNLIKEIKIALGLADPSITGRSVLERVRRQELSPEQRRKLKEDSIAQFGGRFDTTQLKFHGPAKKKLFLGLEDKIASANISKDQKQKLLDLPFQNNQGLTDQLVQGINKQNLASKQNNQEFKTAVQDFKESARKSQKVEMIVKVQADSPARVAGLQTSPNVDLKANMGQVIP